MKFFILFILLFSFKSVFAQEGNLTVVAVGEATVDKDKIVVQEPYMNSNLSNAQKSALGDLAKLIRNDFSFYQKKFFVVESAPNNTTSRPVTNYEYWNSKAIRYLMTIAAEKLGDGMKINFVVEDIKERKQIVNSTDTASLVNLRRVGHQFSDIAYRQITGKESIFKSKIVFVSDRNSRLGKQVKEVFLMDFDGKNVQQLTSHGGVAVSPAMSKDGRYLVYSVIPGRETRKRNIDLYLMDLKTKETHVISSRDGINSGAIFNDSENSIFLTLTNSGNAEIYEMSLANASLRKVTNHFASDVDPSITADGRLMTFLSDRAGKAMIYIMDPKGEEKDVKRISFVGQTNGTPRFSPDGKEIVFSSWLDNSFDLFRINSDGSGLIRLTKEFGSNEDPSFSNDGEFIAFTSQRVISRVKADQNIYIMDRDGGILGAVTAGFGNCLSPRWYNY